MSELFNSLLQLVEALWAIVVALGGMLLPWTPLFAWIAFWLFAVNWVRMRRVLLEGGWIGLILIGLVAVLVWGTIAPPAGGYHHLLGLKLTSFVGKTIYVTALLCIMLLCGALQLSGALGRWSRFEEMPGEEPGHSAQH